jgi:hypothetical protein
MRRQRRRSAAPRCSRGRSWMTLPWRDRPSPIDRASSPPGHYGGAAGAAPNQPAGSGEARPATRRYRPRPSFHKGPPYGFIAPLRSLRPPRLRLPLRLRLRRAPISDALRGGWREGARRLVDVERPGPPRPLARGRRVRGVDQERRPTPSVHPEKGRDPPPEMIRDWGTKPGRLVDARPWMPTRLDRSATRLTYGSGPAAGGGRSAATGRRLVPSLLRHRQG